MPSPTIVLFGRTNVGKSTLFNRLTERREALVSPMPGTTRDYKEGEMLWRGVFYGVIDTGGVDAFARLKPGQTEKSIPEKIQAKIGLAIQKADVIFFLIDAQTGVVPLDRALLKYARSFSVPLLVVGNKADNNRIRNEIASMPRLESDAVIPISASNGSGVGDLLDEALKVLKKGASPVDALPADAVITILGKPNVGKSSLLNALLREERSIVHHEPHTTREPIDTWLTYKEQRLKITDTAGIRRHVPLGLEKQGVEATLARLDETDVALFLFDPFSEALSHQDRALGGMLKETRCSLIIVCNKYDLLGGDADEQKTPEHLQRFEDMIRKNFPFLAYAPIVAIAAKDGWRVRRLLDLILAVRADRKKILSEDQLKEIFKNISHGLGMVRVRTRKSQRQTPKFSRLDQTAADPPKFTIKSGRHARIPFPLIKIVERNIREVAGFVGTPVKIHVERT